MFRKLPHGIQTLLLDAAVPACLLCQAEHDRPEWLCNSCEHALEYNKHACPCCGEPGGQHNCADGSGCGFIFSGTCVPLIYNDTLRQLIHRWKFSREPWLTTFLTRLAGPAWGQLAPRPDVIVPLPSHWRRRWHRGFDQTALLAGAIQQSLPYPIPIHRALVRSRATPPQHHQSASSRLGNVEQAFRARRRCEGLRVALVDDVMTTGATANAAAAALLAAGAQEVQIWVLARVPNAKQAV